MCPIELMISKDWAIVFQHIYVYFPSHIPMLKTGGNQEKKKKKTKKTKKMERRDYCRSPSFALNGFRFSSLNQVVRINHC